MKHALIVALLLTLAACTGQSPDSAQQTYACPDGSIVANISDCEQEQQETAPQNTTNEPEDEQPSLTDAQFNKEAFNQVFTSDEQPTPPVGSSLRDIQARALQKTLDGYRYTYTLRREGPVDKNLQGVRVYVREAETALHYPDTITIDGAEYDRIVDGEASCETCRPNKPAPAQVEQPSIPQPLDILLRLEDASDAQQAQSIDSRNTLRIDASIDGREATVYVDQFSGLPVEVRFEDETYEFRSISLSAPDDAFETITA